MAINRTYGWGAAGFLLLVVLLGPLVVLDKFQTLVCVYIFAFGIAIVGLNLLIGFCGQISLGNSAFMAIGGYTTALLATRLGWSPLATIPVSALLSTVGGILLGIPALKLRGLYLGTATFALAIAAPTLIRHFDALTGGSQGIYITGANKDPFGLVASGQITGEQWLYYLGVAMLVPMFLFIRSLLRSDVGRSFRAIRDGETVAVANGVDLTYYKTLAFALSALLAGVGGSLDVMATSYIGPDSFDVNVALALFVGAAIGGLGTQVGPIVGALYGVISTIYIPQLTNKVPPDIVNGLILLAIIYTMPGGIVGGFYRLIALRTRLRRQVVAPAAAVVSPLGPAAVGAEDEPRTELP